MPKSIIAPFREEHALLTKLGDELRAIAGRPEPADAVELFHLRRHFSQKLTSHLHGEDWVLYPRLRASKDERVAALADRFAEEMGSLSASYLSYARKWTTAAISTDWKRYCEETITILDALTERMKREDRELYACAEAEPGEERRKAA